jgi:hypothetical protein
VKPVLIAALSGLLLGAGNHTSASLLWYWSYSGTGVSASGTFATEVSPDADGFYRITGITGTANGATITGLQPTGTAIPGNSGFAVDNLVSPTGSQLTKHGFGFAVANGAFHNPFYAGHHLDYISTPPYADGTGVEPTIHFTAARVVGDARTKPDAAPALHVPP